MSGQSSEKLSRRKRNNGLSGHSGEWVGFVDITLTQEQKERLAALSSDDYVDCWSFIAHCVEDGYKFSLTKDEKHDCSIATITGKPGQSVNAGFSLSARGPDSERAILVLYFKHVTICDEQRWEGHQDVSTSQLSLWG